MKKIENGNIHQTLVSALSCVLLMAVAGGINEQKLILETWIDDDKNFAETKASNFVYNEIQRKAFLTVVGNSGSGKTATVRHCALKLKTIGYTIVPINKVKNIVASPIKANLKQVHILDDPVGTEGLDSMKLAKADACNDEILRLLKKSNRKILITCRRQIAHDPEFQTSCSFIKTNIIDLHENTLQLSEVEMSDILSKHAENEKLKQSEIENIPLAEIECFNFPLLCKLYAGNKQYRKKGKNFFLNPFPVIVDEIEKLKHRDKLKYYALALCLLHDNQVESQMFEIFSSTTTEVPRIRQLMEACSLPYNTSLKDVETAMKSLVGVYFIQVGEVYSFIHDTLFEATAYSFGKDYPLEMLKHCSSSFVREHVRLSESSEDHYIVLSEKYYPELCQRLIKDIEDGNFHDVFMSQLFKYDAFKRYFSEHLNGLAREKITTLFFETNVNLENSVVYQAETDQNTRSFNVIKCLNLPQVMCIHFLLALGLTSLAKVCLQKLDFSRVQTEALCLLPVACLGGDVEMVNFLTNDKFKCDFNEVWFVEMWDLFTLHMAALSGNTGMMELVMKQDVFVNRVSPDKTKLKIECKKTADLCNKHGHSSLHMAALAGHKDIIELLLKYKANVDLCNKDGESPLFMATLAGHKDIVELLLQYKANVDLCDTDGDSPLFIATQEGHKDLVKLLLHCKASADLCDKDGASPLFIAAQDGHTDIVELLLQYNANVDLCDRDGDSPLYIAAQEGYKDIVKLLLQYNANVDLGDKDGDSPLYMAAQEGYKDIAELLLQNKATIELNGFSPLCIAAQEGYKDIVELLLQYNANVDFCDKDGVSPLYKAAQKGRTDIAELLLQNKATIEFNGFSPLCIAAQEEYKDIVDLLLQYNANVDFCDKDGVSPLYKAAQKGQKDIAELLLQNKATIELNGFSPLCIAAQEGYKDIVELLLQYSANVDFCDKDGVSPLYKAKQKGQKDIVELLFKYKATLDLS